MKRNKSVLQAAVAGAFLVMAAGAQAGTIGTTTQNYATEIFGTGSSAIAIKPLGINYQFGVPVAANQIMYVYLTLNNGALFNGAPVNTDFKCVDAADAPVTASAAAQVNATSGSSSTVMFTINTGTNGFNTNSVCNYNASAAIITNLTSSLSASGGTVSATWAQANTASTSAVPTTGLIDAAGTHTGVILTSSPAISGVVTASSAFAALPETARISVANQDQFTGFTTNSTIAAVNLGSVSFTNNPTTALDAAGVPYTILGQASSLSGKITGSFIAGAGDSITLSTTSTCGAPTALAAPGAPTLTATTATFTAATKPATTVPYYICYTVSGAAAIPATIPAATFTLNKTAATDIADTASGNLYQLQLNGVSREVRSYIPAAASGYTSFVRFINNTSFAAPITGQFVYVDGTTSTAAPISFTYTPAAGGTAVTGTTLPAGGSVTLTSANIEASLGAPSGGGSARPRLLITAPVAETAGLGAELTGYKTLEVQSFILTNANGNFSDATGAQ